MGHYSYRALGTSKAALREEPVGDIRAFLLGSVSVFDIAHLACVPLYLGPMSRSVLIAIVESKHHLGGRGFRRLAERYPDMKPPETDRSNHESPCFGSPIREIWRHGRRSFVAMAGDPLLLMALVVREKFCCTPFAFRFTFNVTPSRLRADTTSAAFFGGCKS